MLTDDASWLKRFTRRLFTVGLIVGLGLLPVRVSAANAAMLEYKVKAGYLFNFAKFIEWPAQSLPLPNSPFVIGVLDNGDAFALLQSLLEGKMVDGHPLEVRRVEANALDSDLHILLVTRSAEQSPHAIRAALGKSATLVVGETEKFAERGGMLGFVREKEVIRINLNLEQTAAVGLKVSSKLATVAMVVRGNAGN